MSETKKPDTWPDMRAAGGSASPEFNMALFASVLAAAYSPERLEPDGTGDNVATTGTVAVVKAVLTALAPGDEVEAMLSAQVVGCHGATMEALRLGAHPSETPPSEMWARAAEIGRLTLDTLAVLEKWQTARKKAAAAQPETGASEAAPATGTHRPPPISPTSEIWVNPTVVSSDDELQRLGGDRAGPVLNFGHYGSGPIPDDCEMIPGESVEAAGDRLALWAMARSGQPFWEDPATGQAALPGVTVPGRGVVKADGTLGPLPVEE